MLETRLFEAFAAQPVWAENALAQHLAAPPVVLRMLLADLHTRGILRVEESADGWRLDPMPEMLDAAYLRAACPQAPIYLDITTDSTNCCLARLHLPENGTVALAEYQSAGRGRRGRHWQSPFAGQIILSHYWHYPDPAAAAALSIGLGLAAAEILRQADYPVRLKWPNDLYLNGRKLGGILVETRANAQGIATIAGIGINLRPLPGIDQPHAALGEAGPVARNTLTAALINAWRAACAAHPAARADYPARWRELDLYDGQGVCLSHTQGNSRGINRGIDAAGQLLLEDTDGNIRPWTAGDISLRPASLHHTGDNS